MSTNLVSVDQFLDSHEEWQQSPRPTVDPQYQGEVDRLFNCFNGEVPDTDGALKKAVMDFVEPWGEYYQVAYQPGYNPFAPMHKKAEDGIWGRLDNLKRVRKLYDEVKLPVHSIEQLRKQKVYDDQIAAIWGVKSHEVTDYVEGKKTLKEGYRRPVEVEADNERKQMLAAMNLQAKGTGDVSWEPSQEKLDDLIRQQISAHQISQMHPYDAPEITPEGVEGRAAQLNIMLPVQGHASVAGPPRDRPNPDAVAFEEAYRLPDETIEETESRPGWPEDEVEKFVIDAHQDGYGSSTSKEVADLVKGEFNQKISYQKVSGIVQRWREAMATAPAK